MRRLDAETKEIQGTLEPSRENEVIAWAEIEKMASPKDWPDPAKVIFQDLIQIIRGGGFLSKAVYIGLRSLSFHEYMRRQAEENLIQNPTDSKWLKVLDVNGKAVERGLAKFGLYPADLYRVPVMKKEENKTLSLLK
jgi:hypothetical protein